MTEPYIYTDWETGEEFFYDTYKELLRSQDEAFDEQAMRNSVRSQLLWSRVDLRLRDTFFNQLYAESDIEISQSFIDSNLSAYRDPSVGSIFGFETYEQFLQAEGYSDEQIREHARNKFFEVRLREERLAEWARDEGIEIADDEAHLAQERLAAHLISDEDARRHWEESQIEIGKDDEVVLELVYEFTEEEMRRAKNTLLHQSDEFQALESTQGYDFITRLFVDADIRVSDPVVRNWLENNEPDEWLFNFEWQ